MPLDFRTYTDPGVYIDAITPPVVFTAAIEPTILAIVGSAPAARDVAETTVLSSTNVSTLVTLGVDAKTVNVVDRLLGTQYVSAALATLDVAVNAGATAWTVSTIPNVILPARPFTAILDNEQVTVSVATAGAAQAWTVTRGVNATVAAAHGIGQVVNYAEKYTTTQSLEVATLTNPVSATQTSIQATEAYGVQAVTLTGFAGVDSFKLTYNGVETAIVTNGTNYTQAGIKTVLEALADIVTVKILKADGTDTALDLTGFIVEFLDPDTNITALTVTSAVGCTGTVAKRGVLVSSYLDIEGERLLVTAVSGSAPQTLTAVRGVNGTTAQNHGAVKVYENSGADYTIRIGAGDDGQYLTTDDTLSLFILDTARISDGSTVLVEASATDASQFSPALFNDMDTVRDKYGDPLDANGAIHSTLSLAAQIAFANGATQLVLVATKSTDAQPVQKAIDRLEFEQGVNTIAVMSGALADIEYVKGHVNRMEDQSLLRRAFVGLNGLANPSPTSADFIAEANTLHDERVILVAPGQWQIMNGTDTPLTIPGYFGAAAVAGLHAGLTPQEPLTRKQVFGFTGLNDQDTNGNIFLMQSKGVCVVFEDRLTRLIIKHGLTTDMSTLYTREISIGAARDRLRDFILETLQGGALLGSAMTAETPNLVFAAVSSALEESVRQNLIFDYTDVTFRLPTSNPTLIEVRFAYRPTLPLNYIHVQFSIDTSASTVEFQSVNQ